MIEVILRIFERDFEKPERPPKERAERVTNEEIYVLCQQILDVVKDYNEKQITQLNDAIYKLETISNDLSRLSLIAKEVVSRLYKLEKVLESMFEGIKILSDNQVVLDEKLERILTSLEKVEIALKGIEQKIEKVREREEKEEKQKEEVKEEEKEIEQKEEVSENVANKEVEESSRGI